MLLGNTACQIMNSRISKPSYEYVLHPLNYSFTSILVQDGRHDTWMNLPMQRVSYITYGGSSAPVCDRDMVQVWRFSPSTLVSFTNRNNRHDMLVILLKVALSTNNHNQSYSNEIRN
jgi:hypothetical protein